MKISAPLLALICLAVATFNSCSQYKKFLRAYGEREELNPTIHTPFTSELLLIGTQISLDDCDDDERCDFLRRSAVRYGTFAETYHGIINRLGITGLRCPCDPPEYCDWSLSALSPIIVERRLLKDPVIYLEDSNQRRIAEGKKVPDVSVGRFGLYELEWAPGVDKENLGTVNYVISGRDRGRDITMDVPINIRK